MKVLQKALNGLFIFEHTVFEDQRGFFYESFNKKITNFNLTFPDLESRLKSFLSIGLTSLDDSQLIEFFSHQAKLKGMRISHGVAEFILNRVERKTHQMISILNILDEQSLEKTKMITIPFVKEALNL